MDAQQIETDCRLFAAQYPTHNVRQAIRSAESGLITWENLYRVFQRAMATAMNEVKR